MSGLTPEMTAIVEKIVKLQNLAANNANEAEAAAASEKAAKLLLDYNLDSAVVERAAGGSGKRELANVEGGFYKWQRELWAAVAELNFCYYWSQVVLLPPRTVRRKYGRGIGGTYLVERRTRRRRHALVGRTLNVKSTEIMARYLEAAIERVLEARFPGADRKDSYITSFREGIAYRLRQRIAERRRDEVAKDLAKANEAERRAKRSGVSTATALTISSYVESERDANVDFRFGDGTSAKWRAERAAMAEENRRSREEYTIWAAANPEKAREREEKEKAKEKRERESASRARFGKVDDGAFWSGSDAAEAISLDEQLDSGAPKMIEGRKRR